MGVDRKVARVVLVLVVVGLVTNVAAGEFCCADSVTAIEQSQVRPVQ